MEENRKGPGVFYAVVGVATLVVAIIGATFAYFSASATVGGDEITGGTQDISGALTAEVTAIYDGSEAAAGAGLVPSDITNTTNTINAAVAAKCVSNGYAGCHLYQIHVKSTTTLDAVELNLASMTFTKEPTDKASWKWVVYQAAEGAASEATTYTMAGNSIVDSGANFVTTNSSIRKAGMTANTDYYYYLMVYIVNDTEAPQNAGDAKNVLGNYKGTISLAGGTGGKVSATFVG